MSYQIQIKPFEPMAGGKYKTIEITDIALHTSKKRPTPSVGKKISQSFKDMNPGRIYSPIKDMKLSGDGFFDLRLLSWDEDFMQMIREQEKQGYKVLIKLPPGGIPIVPGDDTIQFMNSKNGKRLIRGLAKEKKPD